MNNASTISRATSSGSWADKYKPRDINDLMLPTDCHQRALDWIAAPDIPHILVVGENGIGKTSLLDVLIEAKELSPMKFNGALDRGIDLVRKIKDATRTVTVFNERRAIFVDEIDGLTSDAFSGLRGDTITGSSITSVFMGTGNHLRKIPPEVQNHFFIIDLDKEIADDRERLLPLHIKRATEILEQEGVIFELEDVERIVTRSFPSVRAWMKELQGHSASGHLKARKQTVSTKRKTVVDELDTAFVKASPPTSPSGIEPSVASETSVLLDDIEQFIARFVSVKPESITAMALFVLHAHAHAVASHSPLLWFNSIVKRCGKTTALKTVSRLVPQPIITSNVTVAGMLHAIQGGRPTFLIDEMAHALKASSGLAGIILLGHLPDGVRVLGNGIYSVWAPKVLALIGELPDDLEDRSIRIVLRRRLPSEEVERFLPAHEPLAESLLDRCHAWASDAMLTTLKGANPVMPSSLHDRAQDNWRPLTAIADHAGGNWPLKARDAAKEISGRETISEPSPGILILGAAQEWFADKPDEHIPSRVLSDLAADSGAVRGRPLSRMIQVARILSGLDIFRDTIRGPSGPEKGYHREDLERAFAPYRTDEPVG